MSDTVRVALSEDYDGHIYIADLVTDRGAPWSAAVIDVPRAQWERWQEVERAFDEAQEEIAALMKQHDRA